MLTLSRIINQTLDFLSFTPIAYTRVGMLDLDIGIIEMSFSEEYIDRAALHKALSHHLRLKVTKITKTYLKK